MPDDGAGEEGPGMAGHSSRHVSCCAAAASPAAIVQSAFSQWRVEALHATQVVVVVVWGGGISGQQVMMVTVIIGCERREETRKEEIGEEL